MSEDFTIGPLPEAAHSPNFESARQLAESLQAVNDERDLQLVEGSREKIAKQIRSRDWCDLGPLIHGNQITPVELKTLNQEVQTLDPTEAAILYAELKMAADEKAFKSILRRRRIGNDEYKQLRDLEQASKLGFEGIKGWFQTEREKEEKSGTPVNSVLTSYIKNNLHITGYPHSPDIHQIRDKAITANELAANIGDSEKTIHEQVIEQTERNYRTNPSTESLEALCAAQSEIPIKILTGEEDLPADINRTDLVLMIAKTDPEALAEYANRGFINEVEIAQIKPALDQLPAKTGLFLAEEFGGIPDETLANLFDKASPEVLTQALGRSQFLSQAVESRPDLMSAAIEKIKAKASNLEPAQQLSYLCRYETMPYAVEQVEALKLKAVSALAEEIRPRLREYLKQGKAFFEIQDGLEYSHPYLRDFDLKEVNMIISTAALREAADSHDETFISEALYVDSRSRVTQLLEADKHFLTKETLSMMKVSKIHIREGSILIEDFWPANPSTEMYKGVYGNIRQLLDGDDDVTPQGEDFITAIDLVAQTNIKDFDAEILQIVLERPETFLNLMHARGGNDSIMRYLSLMPEEAKEQLLSTLPTGTALFTIPYLFQHKDKRAALIKERMVTVPVLADKPIGDILFLARNTRTQFPLMDENWSKIDTILKLRHATKREEFEYIFNGPLTKLKPENIDLIKEGFATSNPFIVKFISDNRNELGRTGLDPTNIILELQKVADATLDNLKIKGQLLPAFTRTDELLKAKFDKKEKEIFGAAYKDFANEAFIRINTLATGMTKSQLVEAAAEYQRLHSIGPRSYGTATLPFGERVVSFNRHRQAIASILEDEAVVGHSLGLETIMKSEDIAETVSLLQRNSSSLSSSKPDWIRLADLATEMLLKPSLTGGEFEREDLGVDINGELVMFKDINPAVLKSEISHRLERALNPSTRQKAMATQRNRMLAYQIEDNFIIPTNWYIHSTHEVAPIMASANLAGECIGIQKLSTDSYPGFVDLQRLDGIWGGGPIRGLPNQNRLFFAEGSFLLYPAIQSTLAAEYSIHSGHHLALAGISNTELGLIVVRSNNDDAPQDLAATMQACVEQELYVPIVDEEGKLLFTPEEYDEAVAELKIYSDIAHFNQDERSLRNEYPELYEAPDPGGHETIGDHIENVTSRAANMAAHLRLPDDQISILLAAAKLHDVGKLAEGKPQEVSNVEAANKTLVKISGLSQEQRRQILLLIKNDELLGEVLKHIEPSEDAPHSFFMSRYAKEKLEQFNRVFEDDALRTLVQILYQADVRAKGEATYAEWQISDKLKFLGIPEFHQA